MRNISPEDAKTTSEVLDRVLKIREVTHAPKQISLSIARTCILIIKALLALYQPQPFSQADFSHLIKEGKRSKGGRNSFPSTPRPEPPKAQSVK